MAKKKTTKKKTTKKRKVAKKKKAAKKRTGVAKAQRALAVIAGLNKCHLCDKAMRDLDALEKHLFEKHDGFTIKEYKKMYPHAVKLHRLPDQMVSVDEAYRAMTHMAKYGKFPEWFDATKKIDIGAADEKILKAFSSVVIDAYQDRSLVILRYLNVAIGRHFDPAHAALASDKDSMERAREGLNMMREAMDIMHRAADLVKKAGDLGSPAPPAPGGMVIGVAAASIEHADDGDSRQLTEGAVQRKVVAMSSELHGLMQSFITSGAEHGNLPPSQTTREVEAEVVPPEEPEDV